VGEVDGQYRATPVLDRRRAVVVQVTGGSQIVAPGEQSFEALEERRVDRQRVGKRAVHPAGLLDDDPAVAFDDVGADLTDVFIDQGLDRLFTRQDAGAGLANAHRAQRIG